MDFYISEQEVRRKIPDMTGRKRRRPAQKSLFRAGLMDFLFFHADQQKMIFRNKGRTETFRGSTEFYGAVRRGREKSDISFLLPLQFLFPLSLLQITPSVYLRYFSVKTLPSLTAPAQGRGGSPGGRCTSSGGSCSGTLNGTRTPR